jgi:hypothetical protein
MCPIVPAGGRDGRLRLPAPAAHLLGAGHCGDDPRWAAADGAEVGGGAVECPINWEEQRVVNKRRIGTRFQRPSGTSQRLRPGATERVVPVVHRGTRACRAPPERWTRGDRGRSKPAPIGHSSRFAGRMHAPPCDQIRAMCGISFSDGPSPVLTRPAPSRSACRGPRPTHALPTHNPKGP